MRWKDLLIGAAVTLAVTVIGGLLVYFFTQEKEDPVSDKLAYQIDKLVSFDGADNQLSIGALKFSNVGNDPAKNVTANFVVEGAEIVEFNISNSNGIKVEKSISDDKHLVSIEIANLIAEEIVSATYLLNREASVKFNIRSERSIGKEGSIYRIKDTKKSPIEKFISDFVPILVVLASLPLLLFFKFLTKSMSRGDSSNNMAFVLLHTGSADEAVKILERAILNGKDGSHALSNYATALSCTGNSEKAKKFISAAEFLARSKHEKAVCAFNNAVINHLSGNLEESHSCLTKALQLSKSEIKEYFRNSEIWNELSRADNRLLEIVKNA
mgnify:CR=1 FL=1